MSNRGYLNAIKDGIEIIEQEDGETMYKVKCADCGAEFLHHCYRASTKYLCPYCKRKAASIRASEKKKADDRNTHEKRFDDAINRLKNQGIAIDEYSRHIDIARTREYLYGSVPETMVAIELLHRKLKIVPQAKIGNYRVDFAIPTLRLLVEVDGYPFHADDIKTEQRDEEINLMTGRTWKIVHIPASLVSKDARKAVDCILSNRKYVRHG